jgi:hypothetical protein
MKHMEFEYQVAQARKRVAKLDELDGWADREPGTILAALEAGLKNPEDGSHYDAYVMLEDVVKEQKEKGKYEHERRNHNTD